MATGAGPPAASFGHSGEHGGDNGRQPQSAAGAVRKTPAMARHEAPAFSRGSAALNEQWLRHLARHLPRLFEGTEVTTAYPAPKKIRAMMLGCEM
jgi:hypothetical protein